ncbi:class I adenylate-forming enzyme family protein [Aliiroseovarius sp. F47248L]|uniref:class I adenylate-forming enzyme family protein n=1 Tax=Aliiroseovarius sp. F47248L TaxID=2926420 RepID=UPI001FF2448C|nr:class I adenylate-forming enzyme family protein [Aliiroseovarius sp. F47248L]MCK0138814.1 acyl--CoA ligase [Aliiroseovarius sp. F47248L]
MLSEFHPTTPLPSPPQAFNMARYVLTHAADMGDKIALSVVTPDGTGETHWTYKQLNRAVRGVAGGLLAQGLSPGDRVLLRLGNTVDFPLAFLGAIAAGLVPVPTSSQLTQAEITKMAAMITPRLIIADDGIALPSKSDAPVLEVDALHQLANHTPAPFHMGDPERPGYVVFTSGTSGKARAVVHAHRAIWARQMMWDGWYGITRDDRSMHAGAFNWTYTLGTGLMDPWSVGATALIPAAGTSSDQLGPLLARENATIFAAAPGVYRQMLRAPLPALPALRHGLSAGEKLPATTRANWVETSRTPIHEAYGMSECSTFISGAPNHPAPDGTLGYPQPGRHIAVLDTDGQIMPRDTPGIMAVHRSDPGLMLGYLGADKDTKSRYSGDWFLTGDTVSMAKDGAITFEGRSDDIMNAGGFRVSPIEVEAAMALHPGIHEAACAEVAVKDDATIIACFYTPEIDPIPEDTLSTHAHSQLAHYKCPRLFIPLDNLPRGANNKLLRATLRAQFEAGLLTQL